MPSFSKLLKMSQAKAFKKLQAQIEKAQEEAKKQLEMAAAATVEPPAPDAQIDDAFTDIDDGSLTIQPVVPEDESSDTTDITATAVEIDATLADATTTDTIDALSTASAADFATFAPNAEDFVFATGTAEDLADVEAGLVFEGQEENSGVDISPEERLEQAQELLDEANQLPDGILDLLS